jgi:hypothetical protein
MEQEKTSLEKIDNADVRKIIYDTLASIEFYVSECYGQLATMQEVKDFNDAVCALVFAYRHIREAELEVDKVKKQYGVSESLEDKDAKAVSCEIPTDARV